MSEENPTKTMELRGVPVELNNLSKLEEQDLILVEPKEPTVDITISGKRNTLNKISEKDILVTVDLSGYDEGTVKIPIEDIKVPSDVRVVNMSTRELSFKFEKIIRKEMVLELKYSGELPKGYTLGDPEIVPQSLYIEGGRSWIESVKKAVVNVDLSNRTEDISVNAPIQLLDGEDNQIREVEKDKSTANVFIPIYQAKQVPIELVVNNRDGDDTRLGLNPTVVEVSGKKEVLDKIAKIYTSAINFKEIYNGMTVPLVIPEGVNLITKEEIKLIVNPQGENVENIQSKVLKYPVKDMNIIGLGQDLSLDKESLDKIVELTIEGNKDIIDVTENKDLSLQIDLTNLEEGQHEIVPILQAKKGITLSKMTPESLSIKLIKEE